MITAPAKEIWRSLISVTEWPRWYRFSENIAVEGAESTLRLGMRFRWTTQGIRFSTTIQDWLPCQRLGWSSVNPFLSTYHVWAFSDLGTKTLVVTEETQRGILPLLVPRVIRPKLKTAQLVWLDSLALDSQRRTSESGMPTDDLIPPFSV